MQHQKIYNNIILKAKSENRKKLKKTDVNYVYYEKHHVLPKCLGGPNNKENLVLLTAKEHYLCHKLLTFIYKGDYKITCAVWRMTFDKKGKHNISSRDYKYVKEIMSATPMTKEIREKISKNNGAKQIETRNKLSKSHKGKIIWNKNTKNERCWICNDILNKNKFIKIEELENWINNGWIRGHTKESRKKLIGRISSMKGKNHTEESLQKMRKPKTEEHKQHMRKPKKCL